MQTDKVNLLTQINTTKENVTQLGIEPGPVMWRPRFDSCIVVIITPNPRIFSGISKTFDFIPVSSLPS